MRRSPRIYFQLKDRANHLNQSIHESYLHLGNLSTEMPKASSEEHTATLLPSNIAPQNIAAQWLIAGLFVELLHTNGGFRCKGQRLRSVNTVGVGQEPPIVIFLGMTAFRIEQTLRPHQPSVRFWA